VCTGAICQAPTCMDTTQNGNETDVDCGGGTCNACADGLVCAANSDCLSGVCTGAICQAPTCMDGVQNGDETGVDCGGATCAACAAGGHLVINEVDYDQILADTNEFVEIYNGTGAAVSLADYDLVLVNGNNSTTYLTYDLSPAGTLANGQYLVVGSSTVTPAMGALKLDFANAQDNIQNGAPDGVALVNKTTGQLVDALSYEGSITAATVTGVAGMVSLVEGTALDPATKLDSNTVDGSLSRLPNGTDTDNANSDWVFSSTPTPGAPNVP